MPLYLITGVSRGLGWEFLSQISSDEKNTVIGIVRNKAQTEKRIAEELAGRSNINLLEAELTDYNTIKRAAKETAAITGGKLDYIIANAGHVPQFDMYDGIKALSNTPEEVAEEFNKCMSINVLSVIHLYNLFMPQILAGDAKKILVVSSGLGNAEVARQYDLEVAPLYSASKAAVNLITAKFSAQYKKDGVLFLAVCPGMVDVGHQKHVTPEQLEGLGRTVTKFKQYAPDFQGPSTPVKAIRDVLSVLEKKSVEAGDGGAYLSHFGTNQFL